ncbi:MAG: hypothetical protein GX557_01830 [Chloroflexi bacterium]|nr:hypothetical protein [Chloroflexota bacterium]
MPQSGETERKAFWYIGHTHWEGAVFKTRAAYLDMGLPNILRALRLLQAQPGFCFALDQACYVQPFLERYPAEEALLRQLIAEGRLEIVGGTDVMPDVNMPSGESFVRQILYGKGFLRERLGLDTSVGWQLDTFGHHAQMPQIMRLAGYRSFWFFRGVANWDVPSEFLWQGLDGSLLPAYWLAQGYAVAWGSPQDAEGFARVMHERYHSLDRQSRLAQRAGPAGADVCEPESWVAGLAEQFNMRPEREFDLRIAVPSDYERAVAPTDDWPVVRGELNPIFQGSYSSRIELKQEQRDLERLLTTAEKLAALGEWLGRPADQQALWRAWEPVLFNQTHDLASGVMTDSVYHDSLQSYAFSRRLVEEQVGASARAIAEQVDTQGEGIPVVVWNTLSWPRTDVVSVEIGLTRPGTKSVAVTDADGRPVPCQLEDETVDADGGLLRARVTFVACDVPALGHAVYHVHPTAAPAASAASDAEGDLTVLANEHYRLTVDRRTGALTSLIVRKGAWEALGGEGNVVTRQADHGDFWELYQSLDGASRIAMTRQQPVPAAGEAAFSNEAPGEAGPVLRGAVFSEVEVAHPFGAAGEIRTRVRVYAGVERVEFRTTLVNQVKFVRYQVLFPTSITGGRCVQEIPFGASERPLGIEFPAQNWSDYSGGERGVSLLNRGLPGNVVSGDTLMLSLLRSTCIVAYGFGGGYEPGMSSDTGFELDVPRTFDYALVPHQGDWAAGQVYRRGLEFNNPLIAQTVDAHAGNLPARWGWLEVSAPNLVISAVKPGREGRVVVRLYEAAGEQTVGARLRLHSGVVAAQEANLLEDPGQTLPCEADVVTFDMRPWEIKTIDLRLTR